TRQLTSPVDVEQPARIASSSAKANGFIGQIFECLIIAMEESRQEWRRSIFSCSFLRKSQSSSGGHMKKSVALLAMLVILPSVALAQRAERRPSLPSVTANGEAVITVEPDQAQIDIGVVTQARNAPD